jgi:hypothetical protein
MSEFKARYLGSNEEHIVEAASPRMASKAYVEKIGYKPFAIEVWNGSAWISFDEHISDNDPLEVERQRREEAEKIKKEKLILTEKIKETGFNSLDNSEIESLNAILDNFFLSDDTSPEDLYLVKVTLSDNHAYRFMTLRSNAQSSFQLQQMLATMNNNLSSISNKTSAVKTGSLFTGLAAARHLGEQIADDIGGD